MLVEDKIKYCWVDNGKAGEPQDSIKDAIADYLEYISYFNDVDCDCDIEWVRVGHPSFYIPDIDGESVIESVIDLLPDEVYETDEDYLYNVEREHVDELSEILTNVFRAWCNRHGYHHRGMFVENSEPYHIKREEYKEITQ